MGDAMYLIDTNVISELRKRGSANPGVHTFFNEVAVKEIPCYLSVVTIGELVRGSALIRHRGDTKQADAIDTWLKTILEDYATNILAIDQDVATLWGHLRVPNYENALDKQIAATALVYSLEIVTRNISDFKRSGVKTINPFSD